MKAIFSPAVQLMNRLRYPQKFLVLGFVLVLPVIILLRQYIVQTNLVIDSAAKEQLGLQYTAALISFLQDVQQYAGITYALATGDDVSKKAFTDLSTTTQGKVEGDIAAVDKVQSQLGGPLDLGTHWEDIKGEWQRIKTSPRASVQGTATTASYPDVIQRTLTLISIVGNNSNLILDTDIPTYYIMDTLINKVPVYSSYLSDIRTYSTAAAAEGTLPSAARTRLIILLGMTQSALDGQHTTLDYAVSYQPDLAQALYPALDAMTRQINSFLASVNSEILGKTGEQSGDTPVNLHADTIFAASSKAVDSVFSCYALLSSREHELLENRVSKKVAERDGIVLLTLAAFAGATYLFAAFYIAVRTVIDTLSSTAKRMIQGATGPTVVLENRDELATVVNAFNNVARELVTARDSALEISQALSQSEDQLRAILDTSPIPMIGMNTESRILYMNSVAISMFGDKRAQNASITAEDFGVTHEDRHKLRDQLQQRGYATETEIQFRAADDTLRCGLVNVRPLQLSGQAALLIAIVDITALKQVHQTEQRNHNLTQALLNSAMAMTGSLQLEEVVNRILDNLRRVVAYDMANIMIFENEMGLVIGSRHFLGSGVNYAMPKQIDYKQDVFAKQMIETRLPIIIGDIDGEPRFRRVSQTNIAKSFLGVPIIVGQEVIGMISLGSKQPHFFNEDHINYIQIFGLQAGIAIQNARLFEQAKAVAVLEERQRLARELHDAVTQTIYSASIVAEMLPRLWGHDPDGVLSGLAQLQQLTHGALAEMRTLLFELRPAALAESEFSSLLRQLVEAATGRTHLAASVDLDVQPVLLPDVKIALYRIAQEAMNNIVKHAKATEFCVRLQRKKDTVVLMIHDNGRGFDVKRPPTGRFGLIGIRERSDSIGAKLKIRSGPDGTTIRVAWPDADKQGT